MKQPIPDRFKGSNEPLLLPVRANLAFDINSLLRLSQDRVESVAMMAMHTYSPSVHCKAFGATEKAVEKIDNQELS